MSAEKVQVRFVEPRRTGFVRPDFICGSAGDWVVEFTASLKEQSDRGMGRIVLPTVRRWVVGKWVPDRDAAIRQVVRRAAESGLCAIEISGVSRVIKKF